MQDVKIGTEVIIALAESRVIGQPAISYSLLDTNNRHDIRIDPVTGQIFTNATLNYDRTNVYLVRHTLLMIMIMIMIN